MEHPRIVLDTNCLLQILGARSKYHFLFTEFLADRFTLCVSTEILFEYEEILRQKASPSAADLFLKVIARSRNVVRKDPYFRLGLIKQDNDDNKFVEYVTDIVCTDNKKYYSSAIDLTSTYTVSVYATKAGYDNSDVATKEITLSDSASSGKKGDVNGDGVVNAADIVQIVNIIMDK